MTNTTINNYQAMNIQDANNPFNGNNVSPENKLKAYLQGNIKKDKYKEIELSNKNWKGFQFKLKYLDPKEIAKIRTNSYKRDSEGKILLDTEGDYVLDGLDLMIQCVAEGCVFPNFKNIEVQKDCGVEMTEGEAVTRNRQNTERAILNVLSAGDLEELSEAIIGFSDILDDNYEEKQLNEVKN